MDKVLNNNLNDNLEEKDIYKLFNDVNFDEKEYEEIPIEISEIQKKRLKNNLNKQIRGKKNKNKFKHSIVAATIALICLIGVGTAVPGFAKNIPVLNSVMQIIADKFELGGEYDKYSQGINSTVSDNGISLTINEALCDDSQLAISYTLKSDKNIKELSKELNLLYLADYIKINGKNEISSSRVDLNYVDDNTCIAMCEMDVEKMGLPNNFDVELNIMKIFNVKGKWNFKFTVSKEDILKQTIIVKPNKKVELQNCNIVVDKVILNPINTTIMVNGNYKNKEEFREKVSGYINCFVFDDKGFELDNKGGCGGGTSGLLNKYDFYYKFDFESLKEIPKYLTAIPCTLSQEKIQHVKKLLDDKYPIELEQGKVGKLIINEVVNEENKTIIKYTADGKLPSFQANQLLVEDENGKELEPNYKRIIKDPTSPNKFTLEIEKLKPGKKYFLCTDTLDYLELKEEYKFKIPLN